MSIIRGSTVQLLIINQIATVIEFKSGGRQFQQGGTGVAC